MAASAAASAGADMDPVLMQKLALFECQGLPKSAHTRDVRCTLIFFPPPLAPRPDSRIYIAVIVYLFLIEFG